MPVYASVAALTQITLLYRVPLCSRFRENDCILKYLLPGENGASVRGCECFMLYEIPQFRWSTRCASSQILSNKPRLVAPFYDARYDIIQCYE